MSYDERSQTWDQYQNAVVDVFVSGQTVTVGPRGVETDTRIRPNVGEQIYIITAFNPGRMLSERENTERQAHLERELGELAVTVWHAEGRDRRRKHGEASVAVRGLDRDEARLIGLRYGQDAIFEWTRDAWAVIPCGPGPGYIFEDGRPVAQRWFPDLPLIGQLLEAGLTESQAKLYETLNVSPNLVAGEILDAMPFLEAADHHGLDADYVQSLLEEAEGDPDRAWEIWGENENEVED